MRKESCPLRLIRGAARMKPRQRESGGDELRELAFTFRQTVDRLANLMREVEEAHAQALESAGERKRFYRDVLRAVTQGKFELVEAGEIPPYPDLVSDLPVLDGKEYAAAREAIETAALAAGMSEDHAGDLVLAASEAISNAMKHAVEPRCQVYRCPEGVAVRVSDHGSGIRSEDLPSAILMSGFSTKVSLGMGYTMMLKLCDRLWLSTSPEGTVVQLEKRAQPAPEHAALPWLSSPGT